MQLTWLFWNDGTRPQVSVAIHTGGEIDDGLVGRVTGRRVVPDAFPASYVDRASRFRV